MNADKNNKRVY